MLEQPETNEKTAKHTSEELFEGLSSRQLLEVVCCLAKAVEHAEPYTDAHQSATAQFSLGLAERVGIRGASLQLIHLGARLHDIGKIGVPQSLLIKPGKLSAAEFAVVKQHCHIGSEIVRNINFGMPIADVVEQHHEKLDGSGYPNRLTGTAILSEAMIVGVADIVDAMRSNRGYRSALPLDAVILALEKESCSRLPSNYIDAAIDLLRQTGSA